MPCPALPRTQSSLYSEASSEFRGFVCAKLRQLEAELVEHHEAEIRRLARFRQQEPGEHKSSLKPALSQFDADLTNSYQLSIASSAQVVHFEHNRSRRRHTVPLKVCKAIELQPPVSDHDSSDNGNTDRLEAGLAARAISVRDFELDAVWDRWAYQDLGPIESEMTERTVGGMSSSMTLRWKVHRTASRVTNTPSGDRITAACAAGCWSRAVIHPESRLRLNWVLLGAMLMCYDMVVMPLQLSTLMGKQVVFEAISTASMVYWALDLPLSCATGVYHKGTVLLTQPAVAKQYFMSWFASDLMLVLVDWVTFVVVSVDESRERSTSAGAPRLLVVLRSVRIVRILRLLRLLRFRRVHQTLKRLIDNLHSPMGVVIARLSSVLSGILLLNHYIACIWYAIGRYESDEELPSWISRCETTSAVAVYTCAFHWSLTQFTPATQNLSPVSYLERFFACFVVLVALVTFSTFLGKMTSGMSQLLSLHADRQQQETMLRQFMGDNKIPVALAQRMWHVYRERQRLAAKTARMSLEDVEKVFPMPVDLLQAVRFEVYHHQILTLPILQVSLHPTSSELADLCAALEEHSAGPMQGVFEQRMTAAGAYCFTSGKAVYNSVRLDGAMELSPGDWASEAALWGRWLHRGSLSTVGPCTWVVLKGQKFRASIAQQACMVVLRALARYALQFADCARLYNWLDVVVEVEEVELRRKIVAEAAECFAGNPP